MSLTLVLIFGISTIIFTTNIARSTGNEAYNGRDIDELMSIIRSLIDKRDARHMLGADSRLPENLRGLPGGVDARLRLLRELQEIIEEASTIQRQAESVDANHPVVSGLAGPSPGGRSNFSITFTCYQYLPLTDIVLDFLVIPEYMLEAQIGGVFENW